MILSLIFLILASVCDGIIHVLSHNFNGSVFGRFSRNIIEEMWWNGQVSWKNMYRGHSPAFGRVKISFLFMKISKPEFMCHATGVFKLVMTILVIASISVYSPKYGIFPDFGIGFLVYIFTYNFTKLAITK